MADEQRAHRAGTHRLQSALQLTVAPWIRRQGAGQWVSEGLGRPGPSPTAGDRPEDTHNLGGSSQAAATRCSGPFPTHADTQASAVTCAGRRRIREAWQISQEEGPQTAGSMGTRPKVGPGRPRSQGCHRCGQPPVGPHRPEGMEASFEMWVPLRWAPSHLPYR